MRRKTRKVWKINITRTRKEDKTKKTKLSIMHVLLAIVTLIVLSQANSLCLWGCSEEESSSSADSRTKIDMNGDGNVVNLLDGLKQAHDNHMTDIKIGVFGVLGLLVIAGLSLLIWWTCRKVRQMDMARLNRRAMSMMQRRMPRAEAPRGNAQDNV